MTLSVPWLKACLSNDPSSKEATNLSTTLSPLVTFLAEARDRTGTTKPSAWRRRACSWSAWLSLDLAGADAKTDRQTISINRKIPAVALPKLSPPRRGIPLKHYTGIALYESIKHVGTFVKLNHDSISRSMRLISCIKFCLSQIG